MSNGSYYMEIPMVLNKKSAKSLVYSKIKRIFADRIIVSKTDSYG